MKPAARRAFATSIVSLVAVLTPGAALAQASVMTAQVLPPGGAGCAPIVTQGIVAHVREGQLHSFDVTIGDTSYVALLSQVGNESIPFRQMTRFNHGGGFLRHHVDINSTTIGRGLPVSLTLLSSPAGKPTCLTIISFSVAPDGSIMAPGFASTPSPTTPGTSALQGTASKPSQPTGTIKPPTTTQPTTTPSGESPVVVGMLDRLQGLCTDRSATQLWFLLLAVYIVLAALVALAKPPLANKSIWLPLAAILVPLALLLAFWYLVPSCRAIGWVPAVSVLIAIAALIAAFREEKSAINIISLPAAAKPSSSPTPSTTSTKTPLLAPTAPHSNKPEQKPASQQQQQQQKK